MTIDLKLPERGQWQEVRLEAQGLQEDLQQVQKTLDAFSLKPIQQQVSLLKASFTRLKNLLTQAFLPVQQALIPGIRAALKSAIDFAEVFADVMAALFGQVRRQTKTTVRSGGAAIRRFLADFDEIQRLNAAGGGGSSGTVVTEIIPKELSEEVRAIADKILSYLKPLQNINFTAAKTAFAELKAAIEPISRTLFAGLEWAWFNLLVPISKWGAEQLLPAFLQTLTTAMQTLGDILNAAKPALSWLWKELLQPMAAWTAQTLLEGLARLRQNMTAISQWIADNRDRFTELLQNIGTLAVKIGAVKLALELLRAVTGGDMGGLTGLLATALKVGAAFEVIGTTLDMAGEKIFSFLDGLPPGIRAVLNTISRSVNAFISGLEWSINAVISAINGLTLRFAAAIPFLGGKTFSTNIPSVTLPRIPALASGAVLPANKPFLAMVGDQHHGTNIEAPLSTIQEAVRLAMEDMAAGNMAGHEATVSVLQDILEAVLGIHIGDDAIYAAADRYRAKLALVKGV